MPLISFKVHPIAFLCFLRTISNLNSWSLVRLEEITTGSVCSSLRKTCLHPSGKGFNSSFGAFCCSVFSIIPNSSNFGSSS